MASESDRKPFLLRLDPATMAALKAWAADEMRSVNGQMEFLLRGALRDAGRLPGRPRPDRSDRDEGPDGAMQTASVGRQSYRSLGDREPASSGLGTR